MDFAMEIHDSWLLEWITDSDLGGSILFKAWVYRSEGPWDGIGESGWQNVRMSFRNMQCAGRACEPNHYALDGQLFLNDIADKGLLPFPLAFEGAVRLCICLSDDFEERTIRGTALKIAAEGDFQLSASGMSP